MKKMLSVTMLITFMAFMPMKQSYAGTEPFIGEISLFAGSFAPRGFAFCQGQLLRISQNQALFSILGTTYGGDGRTTFALPNLQEAEKLLGNTQSSYHVRYMIAIDGVFPPRQ